MKVCKCGAFIKGRYCTKCSLSATQRGYDSKWRRLRERVLDQEPLCIDCKSEGIIRPAEEVHHIIPISHAPSMRLDPRNLAPLCTRCHQKRHT